MDLQPHIEKFRRRFAEVEAALSNPKVFDHNQRAQELSREYARLKDLIATGDAWLKTVADLAENRPLLATEPAGSELALMAAEEITRLNSHLDELDRLILKGGEIGKRLDFLIQELHREANTMGSKSAALELTHISVDMKVLIEQMREQVQNIE